MYFLWNPFALADITEHLGVEPLVDFRENVVGKMDRLLSDGDSVCLVWAKPDHGFRFLVLSLFE